MGGERGVSSVLGIVMLLGVTILLLTSLLIMGMAALSTTEDQAQSSQIETSLAQITSQTSLTALGDADRHTFDLGDIDDGTVSIDESAGSVTLLYNETGSELDNNVTELHNTTPLGALVHRDDETTTAMQGGGVFRSVEDGGSWMISPPEYQYIAETLTFPIIRIAGEGEESQSVSGSFERIEQRSIFPEPGTNRQNPINEGTVWVQIESEYHHGWYQFFSSRSSGNVSHDPGNNSVAVELSAPFKTTYESAIAVQGTYQQDGQAADVDEDEIEEGANYPSASPFIESLSEECSTDENCLSFEDALPDPIEANDSTYYAETDPGAPGEITFSVPNEDDEVNVLFESGWNTEGEDIHIDGEGTVNLFFKEPPSFESQEIATDARANQLFMYIHSDVDEWEISDNPDMVGVVYAPETDIELRGSNEFTGAIAANELNYGGSVSITFDEVLLETEFEFELETNDIRFLHVTENIVSIDLD